MQKHINEIEWGDVEEALPAFATLVLIPYTYNIAYGIIGGTFFWIIMQILLMPVRLIKKEDPLIKFKILFGIEPKAEPAVLKETAEVEESAPPPADS